MIKQATGVTGHGEWGMNGAARRLMTKVHREAHTYIPHSRTTFEEDIMLRDRRRLRQRIVLVKDPLVQSARLGKAEKLYEGRFATPSTGIECLSARFYLSSEVQVRRSKIANGSSNIDMGVIQTIDIPRLSLRFNLRRPSRYTMTGEL